MAVDLYKTGVSVGVGVLSTVLERMDATAKTPRIDTWSKWENLGALGLTIAGLGIQTMYPRQARLGEALTLSATPLLVKSLAESTVADMMKPKAGVAFMPRASAPRSADWPAPSMVRPFQGVRLS